MDSSPAERLPVSPDCALGQDCTCMSPCARLVPCGLAALAACVPGGSTGPGEEQASALAPPREVRTAVARSQGWERTVSATGELVPWQEVVLAAKVPGRLRELPIDLGTAVERGALVAALESREFELRVAQAEASLNAARALLGLPAHGDGDAIATEDTAVYRMAAAEVDEARLGRERALALAREGVDSQAVLDTAEAALRGAESRLQEARELVENRRAALAQREAELEIAHAQLDETRVEAPFDGVVVARRVGTGAYLASGDPIADLVRIDPLRLALEIPEREAASVHAGQTVRVELEGWPGVLETKLARSSPVLGRRNRALVVEAELPNPDGRLRAGAFARASIVVEASAQALTVPAEALVSFAGIAKVFVVSAAPEGPEALAEERHVTLGRRDVARVEVLAGVEEGEEVVLEPGNLAGGARVRVVR